MEWINEHFHSPKERCFWKLEYHAYEGYCKEVGVHTLFSTEDVVGDKNNLMQFVLEWVQVISSDFSRKRDFYDPEEEQTQVAVAFSSLFMCLKYFKVTMSKNRHGFQPTRESTPIDFCVGVFLCLLAFDGIVPKDVNTTRLRIEQIFRSAKDPFDNELILRNEFWDHFIIGRPIFAVFAEVEDFAERQDWLPPQLF